MRFSRQSSGRARGRRLLACAGLTGLVLAGPALAQEPEEAAREGAARGPAEMGEAEAAIDASREALVDSGITYAQVLADPDNIALNVAYARDLVARGDIKGAAVTLERVLLLSPGEAQVRVFHGLVLYRLQQYDQARAELELALQSPLPPRAREQAEFYLAKIRAATRTTRILLGTTAGLRYDSNVAEAPSDGQRFSFDALVPADDAEEDFSALVILSADIEHDLGYQDAHELVGGVSLYHSDRFDTDRLDLTVLGAEAGLAWTVWKATVTPKVIGDHFLLDGSPFLTRFGGSVDGEGRLTPALRWHASLAALDETYRATDAAAFASERDGWRSTAQAGLVWAYGQHYRLSADLLGMDKSAEEDWEAYTRLGLALTHVWLIGEGQFLRTRAEAETTEYDAPNARLSSTIEREDETYRLSGTYGIPLGTLFGAGTLPDALARVNLLGQVEYEWSDSNLPNYEYENTRAQLLFTRRFDF